MKNYILYIKITLYILKRDDFNGNGLKFYFKRFNEYGYLESQGSQSLELANPDDFNDIDKLLEQIRAIELPDTSSKYYKMYKYEKADPAYINNLKIQQCLIENDHLTEHYLGISGWFRYKYLNNLDIND